MPTKILSEKEKEAKVIQDIGRDMFWNAGAPGAIAAAAGTFWMRHRAHLRTATLLERGLLAGMHFTIAPFIGALVGSTIYLEWNSGKLQDRVLKEAPQGDIAMEIKKERESVVDQRIK